jgi:hypothetical protein
MFGLDPHLNISLAYLFKNEMPSSKFIPVLKEVLQIIPVLKEVLQISTTPSLCK